MSSAAERPRVTANEMERIIRRLFTSNLRPQQHKNALNAFVRKERTKLEASENAERRAAQAAVRATAHANAAAAAAAKAEREAIAASLRLESERAAIASALEAVTSRSNTRRRGRNLVANLLAIKKPQGTARRGRTPTRPSAAVFAPAAAAAVPTVVPTVVPAFVPATAVPVVPAAALAAPSHRGVSYAYGHPNIPRKRKSRKVLRFPHFNSRHSLLSPAASAAPASASASAAPDSAASAALRSIGSPPRFHITMRSKNIFPNGSFGPPRYTTTTHE
jgi:hypothetical protein